MTLLDAAKVAAESMAVAAELADWGDDSDKHTAADICREAGNILREVIEEEEHRLGVAAIVKEIAVHAAKVKHRVNAELSSPSADVVLTESSHDPASGDQP